MNPIFYYFEKKIIFIIFNTTNLHSPPNSGVNFMLRMFCPKRYETPYEILIHKALLLQ